MESNPPTTPIPIITQQQTMDSLIYDELVETLGDPRSPDDDFAVASQMYIESKQALEKVVRDAYL